MVIDASVAAKWFLPEPDSERAIELAVRERLGAPRLIFSEVANAVWSKRLLYEFVDLPTLATFRASLGWIAEDELIAGHALRLAVELNHAVYDCFYLALAIERDVQLVTADMKFIDRCAGTPYRGSLLPFTEWA